MYDTAFGADVVIVLFLTLYFANPTRSWQVTPPAHGHFLHWQRREPWTVRCGAASDFQVPVHDKAVKARYDVDEEFMC